MKLFLVLVVNIAQWIEKIEDVFHLDRDLLVIEVSEPHEMERELFDVR